MDGTILKRNLIWNTVGYIVYLFSQWIITILVVRICGYRESGQLALAIALTSMFHLFAGYGMRSFQVSDNGAFSDREFLISRIATCSTAFAGCILFAIVTVEGGIEKFIVITYMLFKLGEAFVDVLSGFMQNKNKLNYVGYSHLLRSFFSLVPFTFILIVSHNLFLAVLGMVVGSWAVIIFFDMNVSKRLDLSRDYDKYKVLSLLKICFPAMMFNFISSGINYFPRNMLENIYGVSELGVYSSVASPALIIQSGIQILFIPFISVLSKYIAERNIKKVNFFITVSSFGMLLIAAIVILVACFLGKPILILLLGDSIASRTDILYPILVNAILSSFSIIVSTVLISLRKMMQLIVSGIIGLIVCVACSGFFITSYASNGVSFTLIISQLSIVISMFIIYMYNYKKRTLIE